MIDEATEGLLAGAVRVRSVVELANARLHRQLERSAALEERHRIAAELHDGLAQTLSVAAMTLDEAKLALAQQGSDGILPQLQTRTSSNRGQLRVCHVCKDMRRPCRLHALEPGGAR